MCESLKSHQTLVWRWVHGFWSSPWCWCVYADKTELLPHSCSPPRLLNTHMQLKCFFFFPLWRRSNDALTIMFVRLQCCYPWLWLPCSEISLQRITYRPQLGSSCVAWSQLTEKQAILKPQPLAIVSLIQTLALIWTLFIIPLIDRSSEVHPKKKKNALKAPNVKKSAQCLNTEDGSSFFLLKSLCWQIKNSSLHLCFSPVFVLSL